MEKGREARGHAGRKLPSVTGRRGGKAAGELPACVNTADADEGFRKERQRCGFKAERGSLPERVAERGSSRGGDSRAGGEILPVPVRRSALATTWIPTSDVTAIGGGKASEGGQASRGVHTVASHVKACAGAGVDETRVNPRIVSRCNSADRVIEEKAGGVV